MLVATYIGPRKHAAHDAKGSHQALARGTSIGDEVADPLLVDCVRPAHGEETFNAELDQQIPQVEGIEEIGVQKNDEWRGRGAVRGHAP